MMARRTITRTTIGAVTVCGVVGLALFAYQFWRARTSESILSKIDQLALQSPNGVTDLEWAVLVYWTHNLHCSAMPQIHATRSELLELASSLDHSIAVGPNRETIDSLWDIYSAMSQSGQQYRAEYEPVRDQAARQIAVEGDAYFDAPSYRAMLGP